MGPNSVSQTRHSHTISTHSPAQQLLSKHTAQSGRLDTKSVAKEISILAKESLEQAQQLYLEVKAQLDQSGHPLDSRNFEADIKHAIDRINLKPESQPYEPPSIGGFIKEEGVNVLLRTGQVVGGAGQVLLGAGICSGVATCAAGGLIALKGIDNIQSGLRGTNSGSQQMLTKATGNEQSGTLINAGLDLGTSIGGLAISVPKLNSLGNPVRTLFVRDAASFEPAIMQASKQSLLLEAATSTTTIIDSVD